MSAIFHHEDFLLNDAEIITGFQFDDFDGGKLFATTIIAITTTAPVSIGWQNPASFVDVAISSGTNALEKAKENDDTFLAKAKINDTHLQQFIILLWISAAYI